MDNRGWNELEIGSALFPFSSDGQTQIQEHNDKRAYTRDSSFTASVAHWRVEKPVHNSQVCINCFNCWVYCPDGAILARDEKLAGVDYVHCKGCGVCVDVCPTNPKSLLMFEDHKDNQEALSAWPQKEDKKKN
ncbi:4Fe-4S dicluster domain-containing protein [uncultured Helicobacter sp.]|uniref:4Fe-4S dicluster domain-containing protein n=1 Tax=uncultured Helicobacter sp. TaxID=175537 RepID=UPI001C3BB7A6|nr:4Fe-4S dicluster domain-containing protein [Candidatus Helicobacter avicola]